MKRSVAVLALLSLTLAAAPAIFAAASPQTIPAVQQWTTGTGTFTFSSSGRIVVNTADSAALRADARTFTADLSGQLSRAVMLVYAASPSAGDIFLALGATDTTIGTEGYLMTIGTSIQISARAAAGVFYGTRTVMQMIKQGAINQGSIKDWPKGKLRGVMLDVGRKYYTNAWITTYIRDMAYVKYNLLHLHLSDAISKADTGFFRLQCDSHPEIVSAQFYSKADMQGFINLASQYHIMIEPEFDMPGHCSWLKKTHSNLLLNQKVLGGQYWALDLSKDSTYNFVRDIYNEMIPFFPCPYFEVGADEYMFVLYGSNPDEYSWFPQLATWAKNKFGSNAIANDCYRYFVNWADSIVRSKGKIAMCWNDIFLGLAAPVHGVAPVASDIAVDYWGTLSWIGWGGVYDSIPYNRHMMMMNTDWDNFYVVGKSLGTAVPGTVYNSWELNTFSGGNLPAGDPQILGGKFPIWGDVPSAQTEAQVLTSTFQMSRAMAQKLWGAPKQIADTNSFKSFATTIGYAPTPVVGTSGSPAAVSAPRMSLETAERIQLFTPDGKFVASFSGKVFAAARQGPRSYRFVNRQGSPAPGLFICRIQGKGFEQAARIRIVQ